LSFVSKMLNKLIGEWDWSAQEVSYLFLQIPVQDSSRGVVSLDCRPEETQDDLIVLESGDISTRRSVVRRYRDRLTDTRNGNASLPALSLLTCLWLWDWLTWKVRPQASPRVINYYPRYLDDSKSSGYSDYCRVKLMLHHPFTNWPDLLSVENETYGSYIEAFWACKRVHTHPEDFYNDPKGESSDSDSDSGDEDLQEEADESPLADFEAFARRRPGADFTTCEDMLDSLRNREIDRSYDWSTHIGRYNNLCPDVWEQIKAENPIELLVDINSSPKPLNLEQRKLYDTIVTRYTDEINPGRLPPQRQLLLNVDGEAGMGKTFTLLKACARIQEIAIAAGKGNPVFRAAPTGISAFNIVGKTLHSLLRLPIKTKTDLSPGTLQSLQASFSSCRFLIIDEKSMIDLKTLSLIDDRLRAIFPASLDQPFRGLNVLLCGDFFQLPPVGGKPLFSRSPTQVDAIKGHQLYQAFNRTLRLTQIMRQQGKMRSQLGSGLL
jgi:ATP-dependent DNA helicase PIF1